MSGGCLLLGCGQNTDPVDASVQDVVDTSASVVDVAEDAAIYVPDAGEFQLSDPCSGPSAGCGNLWCFPNCGPPGQGTGGPYGGGENVHSAM